MTDAVSYARNGEIAVITVDSPPVNALSAAVRQGLVTAMERFAADDAQAAVLCCAGRTFIAGADISEFGKPPQPPLLPEVIGLIEAASRPVIAALHGTVLGGGLEVALGAHGRVALAGTRLGLPEVTLGLLPGAGGTQRLPRLTGLESAVDLITSGRQISAEDALGLGLIDTVAEGGDPCAAGIAEARHWIAEGRGPRPVSALPAPAIDVPALPALRAKVEKAAKGQPAPLRAFDTIIGGMALPLAEGMALERAAFVDLMASPERAALIHAFFAERAAARPPTDAKPRPVARIGVVGGGTMGQGIAASALSAGLDVTLIERDPAAADRAAKGIAAMQDGAVKRGKLTAAARERMLAEQFRTAAGLDALSEVDLVIEAVFEAMDVKRAVFADLDRICRPGAILATNTSYLDLNAIAAATSRPQDVIGLHFFSPANVMRLLEIVVADATAEDVTSTAFALAKRMGKIAVRSGVCDGFIGNRMLSAYRTAADHAVLDGASPYDVDRAITGFGFAMGPYQVGDLAGLDIGYANRRRLDASRDPRERPPIFADRLVEAGRLGRKSGGGYYRYDAEAPNGRPDPEAEAIIDASRPPKPGLDADQIRARYMAAMVNEGAKILDEGIAARPGDIDAVLLHGYGFPRHKGGPMHWADAYGLERIAQDIRSYAQDDPYFWQLSPLLARLADSGGRFADLDRKDTA
ncbi:3-hydroxyacyl-CoA dehydrogenase [Paracoccus suum]|uniref:3-hydroxyacyl-CoA dehydrogenase n=1 Tax=Paracoccus suum TaxID=2259340 RepID=A0A344PM77_9RHOB|nr:3-hydroxyacyl-CoA dehydrogenase NAD-binding domain-containing protein [Paracoccus suum]AXC50482.1 3-hydroxyacyl-CoA dehydrogenase [Paracoccus suum]